MMFYKDKTGLAMKADLSGWEFTCALIGVLERLARTRDAGKVN